MTLEKCPVCDAKKYLDSALGGKCYECGWYPVSIPYDEECIFEAKQRISKARTSTSKPFFDLNGEELTIK